MSDIPAGSNVARLWHRAATTALLTALCIPLACSRAGEPPAKQENAAPPKPAVAAADQVTRASGELVDLSLGPVTTFAAKCARCHGPEGAFYGDHYHQITDAQLRAKVEQMMTGPGGLRPTAIEIDAMAAYHHALRAAAPFLCITNAASFAHGSGVPLLGEASPDCEVTVAAPEGATVSRAGAPFEVRGVAAGTSIELVAQRGTAKARLILGPGKPVWSEAP